MLNNIYYRNVIIIQLNTLNYRSNTFNYRYNTINITDFIGNILSSFVDVISLSRLLNELLNNHNPTRFLTYIFELFPNVLSTFLNNKIH